MHEFLKIWSNLVVTNSLKALRIIPMETRTFKPKLLMPSGRKLFSKKILQLKKYEIT